MSSILTELNNAPGKIKTTLLEDSRKSIAQSPYYDSLAARNGNVLAIRGEIETAGVGTLVLECVSNTPLRNYPYLEQLDQADELALWKRYLDVAI